MQVLSLISHSRFFLEKFVELSVCANQGAKLLKATNICSILGRNFIVISRICLTDIMSLVQSSLFKFVKVGAEQVTPHLFVQYLTFLRAISNTTQSARHCYNLLRSDSTYGSGNSLVTWDHFFGSLEQYLWHIHEQLEGSDWSKTSM